MTEFLTLRVFSFGSNKPIIGKLFIIPNPNSITLRSFIAEKISTERPELTFSADHHISKVIIPRTSIEDDNSNDIIELLDTPISVAIQVVGEGKRLEVTIDTSTATESQGNDPEDPKKCAKDHLLAMNKVVMTMIEPKYTQEYCVEFRERFNNRHTSREKFLKTNKNTPTYYQQIEAGIIDAMSNPTTGLRPCGYLERAGDKDAR